MAILEAVSVADNYIIVCGAGPDTYLVEVSCHYSVYSQGGTVTKLMLHLVLYFFSVVCLKVIAQFVF